MAALTTSRDTITRIANDREYEAAATIYAGALVALNADGKMVPASDAAGLIVLGRAEFDAVSPDNPTPGCEDIPTRGKAHSGCFRYANSETGPLTLADLNQLCYVEDDQTVSKTGGANAVVAGRVFDIDPEGVWVIAGYEAAAPAESAG